MTERSKNLGKLVSTHGISPMFLQRAAIVTVLSFIFFLAMLIGFYIRQHLGYFLLSTGFMIVYLFTLISWILQKRNVVNIFENGIKYRKFSSRWDEIKSASVKNDGGERRYIELKKKKTGSVRITSSITGFDHIVETVGKHVSLHA
jgi:hypothetical protein